MQTPIATLKSQLPNSGAKEGARIGASNAMDATLTGVGFKVEAADAGVQAVGPGVTEWKWDIEPTQAGRLPLHLVLTAFVKVNGSSYHYGVRTFDRTLQVQSVPVAWYTQLTRFLSSNWGWIAGVVGAFGAFGAFMRRRHRAQTEPDRDQPPHATGRPRSADKYPSGPKPPEKRSDKRRRRDRDHTGRR
jgi:hypothetical protein